MIFKKRFKKLIIFLLIISQFYLVYNVNKVEGEICNQIVAIINKEIITQTEYQKAVKIFEEEITATNPDLSQDPNQLGRRALQTLIDEKLQLQEAQKMGLSVSPEEIDKGLEEIKAKNGLTNDSDLEKALLSQDMNLESLRNKIKDSIILLKIRNRVINPKVHLTDNEVFDYFKQNKKGEGKEVRLSHILFTLAEDSNQETINQVLDKANRVWEEIKKGKDFALAAGEYSQDMETSQHGGDLGYLEMEPISPSFKEELAKLKVGQVSQPVRTNFGIHLIKLVDERSVTLAKNSAQWHEIKEVLINQKMERYYQEWLNELQEKAFIEIKKTKK